MLKRIMFCVVAAMFVGTAFAGEQQATAKPAARASGVQIIQEQEAAKDALERAGFPQRA